MTQEIDLRVSRFIGFKEGKLELFDDMADVRNSPLLNTLCLDMYFYDHKESQEFSGYYSLLENAKAGSLMWTHVPISEFPPEFTLALTLEGYL